MPYLDRLTDMWQRETGDQIPTVHVLQDIEVQKTAGDVVSIVITSEDLSGGRQRTSLVLWVGLLVVCLTTLGVFKC